MLTPEEIEGREFLVSLRGYDRDEVQAFLGRAAEDLRALLYRNKELEDESARRGPAASTTTAPLPDSDPVLAPVAAPVRPVAPAAPVTAADAGALFAQIGQETQRILVAAQEAGDELRRKAQQNAEQELKQARANANKLIAEGERRREQIEQVVARLEAARTSLGDDLRKVGRTLESTLRDLIPAGKPSSTVREAIEAAAAQDAATDAANDPAPTAQAQPEAQPEDRGEDRGEDTTGADAAVEAETAGATAAVVSPSGAAGATAADVSQDPVALRGSALSPLHPKMVRALKRGLQDLQNLTLDRVRRSASQGDVAQLLPSTDPTGSLAAVAGDYLEPAWVAGVASAAALAGQPSGGPIASDNLAGRFVDEASQMIRTQLEATLEMGQSAGEDAQALSDRVGAVFGELKESQAEELAAMHLISAYERGMLAGWDAAGITQRRWVLGKEPRCPEARCRSNDRAGELALDAEFPSGHIAPPVHAGCTCTTVPV